MTPALDLVTKGQDINPVSLTFLKVFYKQKKKKKWLSDPVQTGITSLWLTSLVRPISV